MGPTPVHPDFYVLQIDEINHANELEIPRVFSVEDELIIVIREEVAIDKLAVRFFQDTEISFLYFYQTKHVQSTLFTKVRSLAELNQQLSKRLATHFEQGSVLSLFSRNSAGIRQLLSQMHLLLQQISDSELLAGNIQEEAEEEIKNSLFLNPISKYFMRMMKEHQIFNTTEQHTVMNFAAQETSNVAIVQVTLIAASIGAILGGFLTLLAQMIVR